MRALAMVALLGACEPAPEPAGGSYRRLVAAQTGSAAEHRNLLACSDGFAELSRQPRREVPRRDLRCRHADLEAQFRCFDAREAHLATLSGEALWREADDGELLPAVFRRVVEARDATTVEQELSAAYVLDAEVRNGGFHQFFINSSGNRTALARDGFRRFEMPQVLAILDCAMTAFPDHEPSAERAVRIEQLARWGDRRFELFGVVTDAYYVVAEPEWVHVERYLRAHRAEFPSAGRN